MLFLQHILLIFLILTYPGENESAIIIISKSTWNDRNTESTFNLENITIYYWI